MPIYEYKCDQCDKVFEVRQKFADEPLTVHEECGGPVHRLMSAPALQFKGSGWYVNDYAKNPAAASSAKNGNDSGNSDSSAELKSDSKPKTESDSKSKSDSDSKSASHRGDRDSKNTSDKSDSSSKKASKK